MAMLLQTDDEIPGDAAGDQPGDPVAGPEAGTEDGAAAPEAEDAQSVGVGADAAAETPAASEPVLVRDAAETYSEAAERLREKTTELMPEPLAELSADLAQYKIWGLSVWELVLGFVVVLITLAVRKLVIRVMDGYLIPLAGRTKAEFDDRMLAALRRAVGYFVLLGGFFIAFSIVQLPVSPLDLQAAVWRVLNTLFLLLGGLLAYRIIEIALLFMSRVRAEAGQGMLDTQFVPLIRDVAKVAVIVLVVVTVVQSWGFSAAGLLTGVGIGGLALAFAAQDTVANIFGSFVIYSDRPYKVGDWILISGVEGTVEEIGIRSTRIRKFDKTIVRVPNKVVTSENIQNYSEMPMRRIKVFVGMSYETPTDRLRRVVNDIRELLAGHNGIDQDFWMVNFTELNDYSLDILIYCFTRTTVWTDYMDIRQDILLKVLDICNSHGVEIAFPTQTVFYKSGDGSGTTGLPAELAQPGGVGDIPREFSRDSGKPAPAPRSSTEEHRRGEFDALDEGDGDS